MNLKDSFFNAVLRVYPAIAARQTAEGWFDCQENQNRMVFNSQFTGYYFAWLFCCDRPDNPWFRDADTLDRAIRAWDYYCTEIDGNGLRHMVNNGDDFDYNHDAWGMYYFVMTVELLKDSLPQEKIKAWSEVLRRIASRAVSMIEYPDRIDHGQKGNFIRNFSFHVSNLYAWSLLAVYCYGRLFCDTHALGTSAAMLETVIDYQLPCGCWPESGSSTVKYNDVTISAISIYEHYSGSEKAKMAVRKGLDFVLNTMYPDFTRIETMDGRNRYGRKHIALAAPTYCAYEDGAAYLAKWISCMDETDSIAVDNLHGLCAITQIIDLIPDDAPYAPDDGKLRVSGSSSYPDIHARIVRENGWVIPFCCQTQKELDNRYQLYKQNLVSVFNEKTGLLIGGGHSVSQMQFSSFNVIDEDKPYYMISGGELLPGGSGMALQYGETLCRIEIIEILPSSVVLEYSVCGLTEVDRAYVNIPLVGSLGDVVKIGDTENAWGREVFARSIEAGKPLGFRSAGITMSEDAVFNYPVFPYNSYILRQKKDYSEVFGIVTVELDYLRPKLCVRVTV